MSKTDEEKLNDLGRFLVDLAKKLKTEEKENPHGREATGEGRNADKS